MYSLSLLLGAVAGVNAILGGNIEAVVIPGNQYICAEDCVHRGVFFGTGGSCPQNEAVILLGKDGQPSIDLQTGSALVCPGAPILSQPGRRQRGRKADEAPEQCWPEPITNPDRISCNSNRINTVGGPAGETVQWAEVERRRKEQCIKAAQAAFSNCDKGFVECDRLGRAALNSCMAEQ